MRSRPIYGCGATVTATSLMDKLPSELLAYIPARRLRGRRALVIDGRRGIGLAAATASWFCEGSRKQVSPVLGGSRYGFKRLPRWPALSWSSGGGAVSGDRRERADGGGGGKGGRLRSRTAASLWRQRQWYGEQEIADAAGFSEHAAKGGSQCHPLKNHRLSSSPLEDESSSRA